MRRNHAAVADQHVRVRPFAGADTVEKVLNVIDGLVAIGGTYFRLRVPARGSELGAASRDPQSTFRSEKLLRAAGGAWRERAVESRGQIVRILHRDVDRIGRRPAVFIEVDAA